MLAKTILFCNALLLGPVVGLGVPLRAIPPGVGDAASTIAETVALPVDDILRPQLVFNPKIAEITTVTVGVTTLTVFGDEAQSTPSGTPSGTPVRLTPMPDGIKPSYTTDDLSETLSANITTWWFNTHPANTTWTTTSAPSESVTNAVSQTSNESVSASPEETITSSKSTAAVSINRSLKAMAVGFLVTLALH